MSMRRVEVKRWSPDEVEALMTRTEQLVGLPLQRLVRKHRMGMATASTPPAKNAVHRLVQMFVRFEDSASAPEGSLAETVATVNAAELDAALELFEAWQSSGAWPEFQAALRDAGEYPHVFGTLAVGDALKQRHPTLECVPSNTPGRSPDLFLPVSPVAGMMVEVKSPRVLWQPDHELTMSEAVEVIDDAWDKAKRQLITNDPRRAAMLAIAGMLMPTSTYDTLAAATERWMNRTARPGLFGMAVFNMVEHVAVVNGRIEISLRQESRLRRNRSYQHRIAMLSTWEGPWSLFLTPQATG